MQRHNAADDFPGRKEKPPADKLAQFRQYDEAPEFYDIPELKERRKCTDIAAFVIFALLVIVWGGLFTVVALNSDPRRFINGYDSCGNICGVDNKHVDGISCSGVNYENKWFLISREDYYKEKTNTYDSDNSESRSYGDYHNSDTYEDNQYSGSQYSGSPYSGSQYSGSPYSGSPYSGSPYSNNYYDRKRSLTFRDVYICVDKCPKDSTVIRSTCYLNSASVSILEDIANDFCKCLWVFALSTVISIVIVLLLIWALKLWTACVVWTCIILAYLLYLLLVIAHWILAMMSSHKSANMMVAAVQTLTFLIMVVFLLCLRRRIKMVIYLYKMALEIISHMKCILLQPVLTFIGMVAVLTLQIFCMLVIVYGGDLERDTYTEQYTFKTSGLHVAAMFLTVYMGLWMFMFVSHTQVFIVAYPTISYYFSKDKSAVKCPVCRGYGILMRFHLGTLLAGSLILTIVKIIKNMVENALNENNSNACMLIVRCCIMCCMDCIESLLEMFTKNAYIECAMHGRPLCKSGLRAFRLFWANFLDVLTFQIVTNFVTVIFAFMATLIATIIGVVLIYFVVEDLSYLKLLQALPCIILTLITAAAVMEILDQVIDTVLVCFCEDQEINDGIKRPYYMSRELMLYMEDQYEYAKNASKGCMSC